MTPTTTSTTGASRVRRARFAPALLAALPLAAACGPTAEPLAGQEIHHSLRHTFRVVEVVDGLEVPWSIAFLPDGDMLVTERPGRLRVVRDGRLLPTPVAGVPEVHAQGQGGLLDVALHPRFETNRLVYLSFSKPLPGGASTTAVVRGRLAEGRLEDVEEIFEADSRGRGHYGSRMVFDDAGYLYVTVGDRQVAPSGDLDRHPAQDLSNHHGVVLRLHDDGRVPSDNPFVGRPGVKPEIFSYGHRNAQGLAFHPVTGELWLNEHGPQGGDELNLVRAGANYGWPVVGFGVNYGSGAAIHAGTLREGMEPPVHVWVPSIATSGLAIYAGDRFPEWRGHAFVGGLAGQHLARLELDGARVRYHEVLLPGVGRVRDVREGPDGHLYIAVEARDGLKTPILRLEPVDE